jgi:MinD-like ATPase involved in chromosome partitioning or flagellar assembly
VTLSVLLAVADRWDGRLTTTLEEARSSQVVRRCADLPDLLAAAASGLAEAAVVSSDLRGLDRSSLGRLAEDGIRVLGLYPPGDEPAERRLRQMGLSAVLPADTTAAEVDHALLTLEQPQPFPGAAEAPEADDELFVAGHGDAPGEGAAHQVIAVWGPAGAPGRTTIAVNVAAELARAGVPALLVDADTYGACVAQALGLLDEAPGVAAATRAADQGTLDVVALARIAPEASPRLRVLTGLPRADRWPELREHAFAEVLSTARQLAQVTVIDCGFCLEDDEDLSYDTQAPRRNAATLAALAEADVVLAVGSAEPVGLQRLVRGLQDLAAVVPAAPRVVVNKVRASSVGSDAERRVAEALERFAGVTDPWFVPDDRACLDAAMLAGRTLCEAAAGSAARHSIAALASGLVGLEPPVRRRRLRRS